MNDRTLEEEMAIAVLRGDRAAACALADRLIEVRDAVPIVEEEISSSTHVTLCYEAYHWPEFLAFAKRLGIAWTRRTISITISMPHPDDVVRIEQTYNATNEGPQEVM